MDAEPTAFDRALASVRRALSAYDASAASIVTNEDDAIINVTPQRTDSAPVAIRVEPEAMTLTFGRTTITLDGSNRLEHLEETLALVFRGDFVEIGPGHGQAHFDLPNGTQVRLGATKSPLQRRFGPKHRYAPYSV